MTLLLMKKNARKKKCVLDCWWSEFNFNLEGIKVKSAMDCLNV